MSSTTSSSVASGRPDAERVLSPEHRVLCESLASDLLLDHHQPVDQAFGPGRTAGHVDINRYDGIDTLDHRVDVEDTARARTRAHRHAPLRLRHLIPDAA